MTISPFSRYADNMVIPQVSRTGAARPTIVISPPSSAVTFSVSTYTWQIGDQIDYLAYSAYGDEKQWWRIANANPQILFWDGVTQGTQIRVPNA